MKLNKKRNRNYKFPFVSIVIPCRDEKEHINDCLDSIIDNSYPKDKIEVLVIDGMSQDGTRDILSKYKKKYGYIKMLDNPKKEQPVALNIGITKAKGEIIMRMDAHSTYERDYILNCIDALNKYDADNVGGRWVIIPRDETLLGKAICLVTSTFFGVGNSYYRLRKLKDGSSFLDKPVWEINFAYFCCYKKVFDKIGSFNEDLYRSEDIDFRKRLKKSGYRSLFVPSIECYYSIRTNYFKFLKHMLRNGLWVFLPLCYSPEISFSLRHIIPFIFILGLIIIGFLSFFYFIPVVLLFILCFLYILINLFYSIVISYREKDLRLIFILPVIFLSLHISYGSGSLYSFFVFLFKKIKNNFVLEKNEK